MKEKLEKYRKSVGCETETEKGNYRSSEIEYNLRLFKPSAYTLDYHVSQPSLSPKRADINPYPVNNNIATYLVP